MKGMNDQPEVSVIIASYNYGFTIAETVASLQRQSLASWEAIIVDDGSTDNTADIVSKLAEADPRITYMRQANAGVSAARNEAMKIARGIFIQFLDADDLLSPDKLQLHSEYLRQQPATNVVYSNVRYFQHKRPDKLQFSMDGKESHPLPYESLAATEAQERLFIHNIVPICAPLFRREVMEQVGLYDALLTSLEDWEYWFRVAIHGYGFAYLDDDRAWALIRIHRTSLSWNWDRMTDNRKRLRENMDSYIGQLIKAEAERNRLLALSEDSFIKYYGYAVFMNIKYYNFFWGARKAVAWAMKFGRYKYFIAGGIISTWVRLTEKRVLSSADTATKAVTRASS